jgi:hypothetical protein
MGEILRRPVNLAFLKSTFPKRQISLGTFLQFGRK